MRELISSNKTKTETNPHLYEYIKDLHYPGVSLAHGLYDFLLYAVRLTLV